MRNRMYGGVRGRKTKVGENYFVFLLLDCLDFGLWRKRCFPLIILNKIGEKEYFY
jgi:hypothetical protein